MPRPNRHTRLLILGSGPAGMTAALYAARAELAPLVLTGTAYGGHLSNTTAVDNWPADVEGVQGPDLVARLQSHAEKYGAEVAFDCIRAVDLRGRPIRLEGESSDYSCDALIIATGASPRMLGLASEASYLGKGVSTCAACDGHFFRGQTVAVVGGGSTALDDALHLSGIAARVVVVHRGGALRGEKILQRRLRERPNVELRLHRLVRDVLGDGKGVTGMRLENTTDGSTEQVDLQGIFVAVGRVPNTALFEGQVLMQAGYIATRGGGTGGATMTSVPGVFAAGEVQDPVYHQAITSAASGCMAARDAERYLDGLQ